MGVHILNSADVIIKDLNIKDCWGDCIYIGGRSRNVVIDNCFLDHGRRQGISVVSASDVYINNCIIANVGGTAPQYAIDIEPNAGAAVRDVFINGIKVIGCQGGIMGYGRATDAEVGMIEVKNCIIEGTKLCPIYFENGRDVIVEDCKINKSETVFMIVCNEVENVRVANNSIFLSHKEKKHDRMISVNYEKQKSVENNLLID